MVARGRSPIEKPREAGVWGEWQGFHYSNLFVVLSLFPVFFYLLRWRRSFARSSLFFSTLLCSSLFFSPLPDPLSSSLLTSSSLFFPLLFFVLLFFPLLFFPILFFAFPFFPFFFFPLLFFPLVVSCLVLLPCLSSLRYIHIFRPYYFIVHIYFWRMAICKPP